MKLKVLSLGDFLLYFLVISIYCFDGDASLNKILYLVSFAFMAFVAYFAFKRRYVDGAFFKDMAPFLLVCVLSCLWSVNSSVSLGRCSTIAQNFLLFGLLYIYVVHFNKQIELIKAISLAGFIFALYIVLRYGGISQFISLMKASDVKSRIGGDVAHLSQIGQSLCLSGIATCGLFLFEKKRIKKIFYEGVFCIEVLVILASQSRTGLALLLVGSLLLMFLYAKSVNARKWIFSFAISLVLVMVLLRFLDFTAVTERWDGLFSALKGGNADASTNARFWLIREGIRRFIERPFGGYGIAVSGEISVYKTYFHNNYVELLATVGLFGTITFYLPYIKYLCLFIKHKRERIEQKMAFAFLIIQLLLMVSTVTYYVKYQYVIFVLIIACAKTFNGTLIAQNE